MDLLLLKDVRKLGHVGDVVKVSTGYARNYLLPQRLATEPTEANVKAIEAEKRRAAGERAVRNERFADLAGRLKDAAVTIEAVANPEGTLYGSVGKKEIANALQTQGFEVLPEHIVLATPFRTLDNRVVNLEFTDEITAQVKVWVVRQGELEHAAEPTDASGAADESSGGDSGDDAE
jgi:large subunit ribosomal protein L9